MFVLCVGRVTDYAKSSIIKHLEKQLAFGNREAVSIQNGKLLNVTELFAHKWLILYCVDFAPIKRKLTS